jgi:hypothetical protein
MSMSPEVSSGRPTSYLDRTWLEHWTVLALTPIRPPAVADLRAAMLEFMTSDPGHPLCSVLSHDGRRWLPVPSGERLRHVSEVIIDGGRIDVAEPFSYLDSNRPDPASSAPFKVVVGPDSVTCYFAHVCGDAAVFSPFSVLMALGDIDGLKHLRADAGLGLALRIFGKELPSHWRQWWQYARGGTTGAAAAIPESAGPPPDARADNTTTATGIVLNTAEFSGFNSWRKLDRPGLSATALMASAAHRALVAEGVPVDDGGFFTLVDLRRHLPKKQAMRPGNLAKSTYVRANMAEPQEVGAALKQMVDSARAVPALLSGAITAALGNHAAPSVRTPATVTMTFNSMMRNPGVEHIPWTDPALAQYITMSYPAGADGISVSACVAEGRMFFSASFDPAIVDRDAVDRALHRLRDMPALFEDGPPLLVDPVADTEWIAEQSTNGVR